MRNAVLPLSSRYREAIRVGLLLQVPCVLLSLLMLDGGRMARICGAALIGFWAGVTLIMARRPQVPRGLDLAFIRWGFLPLFVAAVVWASLA